MKIQRPHIMVTNNNGIFRIINVSVGILILWIGGVIYVAFRPQSIYLFRYLDALTLSDYVLIVRKYFSNTVLPDFIIYALPDGLWITSYIFIMVGIWNVFNRQQLILCSILPVISILSELGQFCGIVKGTPDYADIVCYATPYICYLSINHIINKLHKETV